MSPIEKMLAVLATVSALAVFYRGMDKAERIDARRPYDWQVDGECNGQSRHVRIVTK